ncbi:molybdopterin oxidoreductase family protein [Chloroflexota bacterium]
MDTRESICLFCPLGCDIAFRVRGEEVVGPEFCGEAEKHAGRVCGRGLYGTELLNHPKRIATPLVREDGHLKETSWDAALKSAAAGLRAVMETSGPESIAIVTEPTRSIDELRVAGRLARAIGTDVISCAFEPQDWPLLTGGVDAGVSAIEEASCAIVLGDVFASHPVLAKEIIEAKYTARGNSLFVIDPRRSNTAWYASTHVQNRAGTEALVLALFLNAMAASGKVDMSSCAWLDGIDADSYAEACAVSKGDIARIARSFVDAEKAAVVLAPSARGTSDAGLVAALSRLLAEVAGEGKECVCLAAGGNARGTATLAHEESWMPIPQLIEGLLSGKYKALVNLGADLHESYPSGALQNALSALDFSVSFSMFHGVLEQSASVVIGASSWLESAGSAELYDGRVVDWKSVGRPSWATRPIATGVEALIAELGATAKTGKPGAIPSETAEVQWAARLEAVRKAAVSVPDGHKSLVCLPGAGQSASGAVTGRIDWARQMFPAGFVEMSIDDAARLCAKDGDTLVLSSANANVELVLKVTDRLTSGTVAVPAYDITARLLFDWTPGTDGWFETGPVPVKVSKKQKS